MTRKSICSAFVVAGLMALLVASPSALAAESYKVISSAGSGSGQTIRPGGLAVDEGSGRLYVADSGNNRISVFDEDGNFEESFGWGVKDNGPQFEVCTSSCRKGSLGSGLGQLSEPRAIAIDNDPLSPSYHDLYVVDTGNLRIQKFDVPGGEGKFANGESKFELTFGGGVNKTTSGDVCTAASGNTCGGGSNGAGEGEFSSLIGSGVFVGVAPGGTIYALDSVESAGKFKHRLQKFEPSGVAIPPQRLFPADEEVGRATALAIDSAGSFYVANEGLDVQGLGRAIRKYDPGAVRVGKISGVQLYALATNSADSLFSSEAGLSIGEYGAPADSDGTQQRRFGYGITQNARPFLALAPSQSAEGDLFASEEGSATSESRVLHLTFPPPGPVVLPGICKANPIGNVKATLNAEINPEGKTTEYHFEYLTQAQFESGGFSNPAKKVTPAASLPASFNPQKAAGVADVEPETSYRCRVVAENADGEVFGEVGAFESRPRVEFGSIWTVDVGAASAVLNAEVNPLGIESEGHFEYLTQAQFESGGFSNPEKKSTPEENFGDDEVLERHSAQITGLEAGTVYRYRIVASGVVGPERTFTTFVFGPIPTPDSRAYELVSPNQKNSAEVATPGRAGGFSGEIAFPIQASAGSGEAITYTSWTSFGQAEGATSSSQYFSRRGSGGWSTENVSPLGFLNNVLEIPYRGFTPELGFAGVVMSEPPLAPGAIEDFENLYLRNDVTGELRALTTEPPRGVEAVEFCTGFAGATEDGSRAFFAANGALTSNAPEGDGFSLYEWSTSGGLRLVSLLPGNTPAAPFERTGFGSGSGFCSGGEIRPAFSADGSRVFWTYVPKTGSSQLLARVEGKETIQLDAKAKGVGASGKGVFQGASADGSAAFFTDESKLTPGASANGLYRYDLTTKTLENLTPGSEPADAQGVVGASKDGSYVYFVARGSLAAGASVGKDNLYLHHDGEGISFIGTLSIVDAHDWDTAPRGQTARVSPDGRHLAFLSIEAENLVEYDNTIAEGESCQLGVEEILEGSPLCAQAFLYAADTDELTCVSCNPSRSRPLGPTLLPTWSNPYESPRYLSDDGSRFFFESYDALTPGDVNAKRDVYEFEQVGKGNCSTESTSFDPNSGACLFLVSSGNSSDNSYLLDASSDGRDAFFSTRQRLVGWDQNDNYDVYDFREGGGFPEPPPPPSVCLGEACRPPANLPPLATPPGTGSFSGPGNVKPVKKKPRKAKKHHKKRGQQKSKQQKRRGGR